MEICDGMRQEKEQENIKYQSQRPKCMSVVNSSTRADVCGCQRELFLANEEVELRRDFFVCPSVPTGQEAGEDDTSFSELYNRREGSNRVDAARTWRCCYWAS